MDRSVQGRKVQTGYTALIEAPTHELLNQGLTTITRNFMPYKTSWYGSNFHREETKKLTFWALVLHHSLWRKDNTKNLRLLISMVEIWLLISTCLTLNLVSLRQHGLTVSLETTVPRVPINARVCVYDAQKYKRMHVFGAHASQGPTKTGYYPDIFATVLENPHDPPFCSRGHVFTENAIWPFSAFNNEIKSNFIYWTERKPDRDPQEILGLKKCVFSSKWLEQVQFINLFSGSAPV